MSKTYVTVEVICEEHCTLTKRGSWVASMRSAVMIAGKHHKATGHVIFARLTQETVYFPDRKLTSTSIQTFSAYAIEGAVEYVPPRQRRKKRSTAPAKPQAASGTTARGSSS